MKLKKLLVTLSVCAYVLIGTVVPVLAKDTFSSAEHRHYVPKTCSSTASDSVTNEVVDGISFYITKINNGSDKSSNYNYIRLKLVGSSDTIWTVDTAYKGYILTNSGTTVTLKLPKQKYFEIFTASTANNNVYAYYYGNSSSLDAYVYIREGVNEEVQH